MNARPRPQQSERTAPKRKLSRKFYDRDTATVARELLGQVLVRIDKRGRRVAGRIVETEAYVGTEDRASHSYGNRRTKRTETMYLEAGHAYVYLIYGISNCFNAVTRGEGDPQAVLIRAIEPLEGIEIMRRRRRGRPDRELTNGPGKLCQALGIDRNDDGLRLDREPLFIERGVTISPDRIVASPRIGVDYAGAHSAWPLRFQIRKEDS